MNVPFHQGMKFLIFRWNTIGEIALDGGEGNVPFTAPLRQLVMNRRLR